MTRLFRRCAAILIAGNTALAWPASGQDPQSWAVAETRDHPLVGTVLDTGTAAALAPADVLARMGGAVFVLLGEVHDNPAAHAVQARVLQALVDAGRAPAVVWEMVRRPRQEVFDDPPAQASALGPALGWAETGWPDWAMYAPIAAVGLANDLPMLAGDLPRDTLRAVGREGLAALDAALAHIAEAPLSTAQRAGLLDALRVGHCDLLDDAVLATMLPVQQARDASLTAALLAGAARADGAVLIAGNGHTRRDWGVPHYLAAAAPEADLISLGIVEVVPGRTDAVASLETDAAGEPVHDLLWFVPRAHRDDPCAAFERSRSAP